MIRKLQFLKTAVLSVFLLGGANLAWAGDFIDDATTIKVANNETSATSGDKKTLAFTPTGAETAIEFTFSSGKAITPGQIFGVVEYSGTGTNTGNCRFRNFTIGGTELEEGTKASQLSFTVNGNTVVLCPFLQNDVSNTAKVLKTYYKTNVDAASLSLTYCKMYVGATASTEVTFKRIGIYTLGEILTLYPDLKTNNFQINDSYRLLNDGNNNANNSKTNNGTDNGWIETKNNGGDITTVAGCKLFVKAVDPANLPSNYNYLYFRRLSPTDNTKEDIFSELKNNQILMLSFEGHILAKLPTMHKKLIDINRNMYNYTFVDGDNPTECNKVDVKGDQTANWATYSRELKAGYNSCAMPFKKIANASDVPAGISFYKVSTLNNDGKIVFAKIDDPTAANTFTDGTNWTPVIIKAETGGVYTFVGRDGIADLSGYKAKIVGNSGDQLEWVGSFVEGVPDGDYASSTNYGISTDGKEFLKMVANDTKTTYYRAFIADKRPEASRALSISFDDGDGTTAIVSPEAVDGLTTKSVYYDLQGRRVANPSKGLYIVNGKKVIIK